MPRLISGGHYKENPTTAQGFFTWRVIAQQETLKLHGFTFSIDQSVTVPKQDIGMSQLPVAASNSS